MDDADIRLECLRLANELHASNRAIYPIDVVTAARAYADFVLGTKDAEILSAARVFAAKVGRDAGD